MTGLSLYIKLFYLVITIVFVMYVCSLCNDKSRTVKGYVEHFRNHRNVANFRFPCPLDNCIRNFNAYASFRSHVLRDHPENRLKQYDIQHHYLKVDMVCQQGICGYQCNTIKLLISHIKSHIDKGQIIFCPFEECNFNFCKKSSFSSHLTRKHRRFTHENLSSNYILRNNDSIRPTLNLDSNEINDNMECSQNEELNEEFDEEEENEGYQFLHNLSLFYLKLQSKYVLPATVIQKIIEEFQELHNMCQKSFSQKIVKELTNLGVSDKQAKEMIDDITNSDLLTFCNEGPLRSDQTRKTFFKSNFGYIAPIQKIIGRDEFNKQRSFQYIPILQSITALYEYFPKHFQFGIDKFSKGDVLEDIHDGMVFKDNALLVKNNSLQIILYQDAFEVVNPLGSAKGKHKLLAVYYTLGNFRSYHRSSIDHIQLVLLCKERDLKEFGQNRVFQPLLEDLKRGESYGIDLSNGTKVFSGVFSIVGDNLGSHCIGGFMENFNSHYFCRYCLISKIEFEENPLNKASLRSVENYNLDVNNIEFDESNHGVKFNSCFNELKYFHVCSPGLPPCLGHDLFEGVVAYDLALFIRYFVKEKKFFTYDQLNKRIKSFQYLGSEAIDKPSEVNSKKEKLSGHAVQNWVFLRLLPLLIGKYITDTSDEVWELCLQLKEIVEMICCPKISKLQLANLSNIVEDYLYCRKELFKDTKLRPKHHYLSHYAELTFKFGPLIRLWTMRFESKHSYFKRCAIKLQNFKHIDKTLAERHQLLQAFYTAGCLFPPEILIEKEIPFSNAFFKDTIIEALSNHNFSDINTTMTHNVTCKGTIYKTDMFVIIGICDTDLILGKIITILHHDNQLYFIVICTKSEFVPEIGLHMISNSQVQETVKCISHLELVDYQPYYAYNENTCNFISLKHSICSEKSI